MLERIPFKSDAAPERQYTAIYRVGDSQEKIGVTTRLGDNPLVAVLGIFSGAAKKEAFSLPPDNYFVRYVNGYMEEFVTVLKPPSFTAPRYHLALTDRSDPLTQEIVQYVQRDWQRDALSEIFVIDPIVRMHMLLFRELWDKSSSILEYGKIKIAT